MQASPLNSSPPANLSVEPQSEPAIQEERRRSPSPAPEPVLPRAPRRQLAGDSTPSSRRRLLSPIAFGKPDETSAIQMAMLGAANSAGVTALPEHAEVRPKDPKTEARYLKSMEAAEQAKPAPTYAATRPAPGAPWSDKQVEAAWKLVSAKQTALKEEQARGPSVERAAQIQRCLAVDLALLAPGTALQLAPVEDIDTKYKHFRAACQGTDLTFKDGGETETEANGTLNVLLRAITEGNVFPPDARVDGRHPYELLGTLSRLSAPDNEMATETLHHLLQECSPKARADLGAVALMDMEQQVSRSWQDYALWAFSTGLAGAVGSAADKQEVSVRKNLGLKPGEAASSAWDKFVLAAADATTSGDSEVGDGLIVNRMDNLAHHEGIGFKWEDLPQMAKSWLLGTITALPSSALTYANLHKAATVALGLPANLIAAVGSAAPLPMALQKRNDLSRAVTVELIGDGLMTPMHKDEIGRLADASERISTSGQIMQKGGAWTLLGGLATWLVQSGKSSQGEALAVTQRLLLNPMEAHSMIGGGLLAEYASFLGTKRRSEKSADMTSLVLNNALEGKETTIADIIDVHEPSFERLFQGVGRGVSTGVNALVNAGEKGVRASANAAARTVGYSVKPPMRNRIDYDKAGPGRNPGGTHLQASISRLEQGGDAMGTAAIPMENLDRRSAADVDLERGDLDFGSPMAVRRSR
ncbi:hypothetical protein FAZ69_21970 [Trinickia terrae]|uniref:Uncharacterized protein n=1 Tax=Trinickia terrae TaxID=2571161 RepID=A0A4U1HWH1_9BURK|nr:hypothetical protein [Trinickia terrae]TKC85982.1 hypothetical protein FAZ69_21970 [Trinickia terrae]